MKSLVFISMILAVLSFSACGKKGNVPQKVKLTFTEKFPEVKKVEWENENDSEWEAEFKMNSKEYMANFSSDGKWLETEYEVKESDIPNLVKSALDKEFGDYDIEEVEISETADGKVYELALEKDDTDIEIVVSQGGEIVKRENKDEDKDDEESDDDYIISL